MQQIAHISLLVNDYDEAIAYYTRKLNFQLVEDTIITEGKRWVLIAPPGYEGCSILLSKAANTEQLRFVGNQAGGRVFLFLKTDDFGRDYENYRNAGVEFVREPVVEEYGTVAVFKDLYGNLWDLIGPGEM